MAGGVGACAFGTAPAAADGLGTITAMTWLGWYFWQHRASVSEMLVLVRPAMYQAVIAAALPHVNANSHDLETWGVTSDSEGT